MFDIGGGGIESGSRGGRESGVVVIGERDAGGVLMARCGWGGGGGG